MPQSNYVNSYSQVKDFLGSLLRVGDVVATTVNYGDMTMTECKILSMGQYSLRLSYTDRFNEERITSKYPAQVIKIS